MFLYLSQRTTILNYQCFIIMIIKDEHGNGLAKIQERILRIKDSMEIEEPHGQQLAMIKKALITSVRERWVVKVKNGPDLEVKGNLFNRYVSTRWRTEADNSFLC
jgi:uncharacterized protein YxjI